MKLGWNSARRSRVPLILLLVVPALAIFAAGYLFPVAQLVLKSFRNESTWSLLHYQEIASSGVFAWVLFQTLLLAVVVTLACLILAYPLAYSISRCPPWLASLLLVLVTLPYLTSILIRTYAWTVLLSPAGLINQLLLYLGI